jgi:hypothetical protein
MTSSFIVEKLVHAPKNLVGCILLVVDDDSHIVVEILALASCTFDLRVLGMHFFMALCIVEVNTHFFLILSLYFGPYDLSLQKTLCL